MAYSSVLYFGLCFLLLFHGGLADQVIRQVLSQPQSQRRLQTQCQIERLKALRPKNKIVSEGGFTEFWDQNEKQLQCAVVAALRHTIFTKGLLLPSFNNAPQLFYVVQGRGIQGAVFPGCPETFQIHRKQRTDMHQKLRRIKEGDVVASPAGVAQWIYNDGQKNLILVSLVDVGSPANQLDQNFRKFFLAGNPQEEIVSGGQSQSEEEVNKEKQQQNKGNSLISGFGKKILASSFGIDTELAEKLWNEDDRRGAIVKVQRELQLLNPELEEEEQEQEQKQKEKQEREKEPEKRNRRKSNGLEETFCTMRLRHRIADPSLADVFNPRGGRITTLNSFKFPILGLLQLSAERGVLYKDAMYGPLWCDAHSIAYIIRGEGNVQIVGPNGDRVFDGQVEEGQMLTVPQNFAVVMEAGKQGLEWIAFKTSDNAMISQIAGRVSVFQGMPLDVLRHSFGISKDEAWKLKNGRRETTVFSPLSEK